MADNTGAQTGGILGALEAAAAQVVGQIPSALNTATNVWALNNLDSRFQLVPAAPTSTAQPVAQVATPPTNPTPAQSQGQSLLGDSLVSILAIAALGAGVVLLMRG